MNKKLLLTENRANDQKPFKAALKSKIGRLALKLSKKKNTTEQFQFITEIR